MPFIPLAAMGGLLNAAGSAVGKLTTSSDSYAVATAVQQCQKALPGVKLFAGLTLCDGVGYAVRGLLLALLITLNSAALAMYVKGMSQSGSFVATVLQTGVSFVATAVVGWACWGEALSLSWWAGATLIVTGVVLMATDQQQTKEASASVQTGVASASASSSSSSSSRKARQAAPRPSPSAAAEEEEEEEEEEEQGAVSGRTRQRRKAGAE